MNVNELMSREPRSVRIAERLDAAARVLWDLDCGIVPVVDAANVVVGVLTDRDLCMAAFTQGRSLGEIAVTAAMARSVKTCRADEPLASALATMQQNQVRRLPVVDARGVLVGILSTNDLVRTAQARPAAVEATNVVRVLAAIGAPRRADPAPAAAKSSSGGNAGVEKRSAAMNASAEAPSAQGSGSAAKVSGTGSKPKGKSKSRKG